MGCGIGGAVTEEGNLQKILYTLAQSQNNRGDASTGFGVFTGEDVEILKGVGGPRELHTYDHELPLEDIRSGIGVTRYPTSGVSDMEHAQPFRKGELVVTHNGNVANTEELMELFPEVDPETRSDTELVAEILAGEENVVEGIRRLEETAVGSYNLAIIDEVGRLYAYRDSIGHHPLWYVEGEGSMVVASEDFALNAAGFYDGLREVSPGELLVVDEGVERMRVAEPRTAFCPFEVFYFMNPGSSFGGELVRDIRTGIGFEEGKNEPLGGGYVCVPVKASGVYFAEGYYESSGLDEYRELLTKNRHTRNYQQGRSPVEGLTRREKAAIKHVPVKLDGEKVVLVDDSQVRGDTSAETTRNLYRAGASEVHWRFMFPKISSICFYGLDHSSRENLIAVDGEGYVRSDDEIAEMIGADSVRFGSRETFEEVTQSYDLCWGCVGSTEEYPTRVPEEIMDRFEPLPGSVQGRISQI